MSLVTRHGVQYDDLDWMKHKRSVDDILAIISRYKHKLRGILESDNESHNYFHACYEALDALQIHISDDREMDIVLNHTWLKEEKRS